MTTTGPRLWLLAIAVIAGLVVIQQSLVMGQLALPPTYDDISYFVDATRRLAILQSQGLSAFLDNWLAEPPHSPFATAKVLLAFTTLGVRDWAPAAANILVLVAVLAALDRLVLRDLPTRYRIMVAATVAAWPLTAFLVLESRPDIVVGFLIALGVHLAMRNAGDDVPLHRYLLPGAVFGLALICKPTFLPVTLGAMGLSVAVNEALGLVLRRTPIADAVRAMLPRVAVLGAAAAVVALLHFGLNAEKTLRYIYTTLFGAEKDLWAVKLSTAEHFAFYLWGDGGWALMNHWFFTALATFAVAMVLLLAGGEKTRALRLAATVAVYVVIWAVISVSQTKTVFLGAVVAWAAVVTFLASLSAVVTLVLDALPRRRFLFDGAVALALTAGAVAGFRWHWDARFVGLAPPTAEVAAARNALVETFIDTIRSDLPTGASVYFPAISDYLNADLATYELNKRRMGGSASDGHRSGDPAQHAANIEKATHVVVFAADDNDVIRWLPSYGAIPAVTELLEKHPQFQQIAALAPPVGGGPIRIFARIRPFAGVEPVAGFLPIEGPYPQWSLPQVRWSVGTAARLRLTREPAPGERLVLRLRTPYPQQVVTVSIGETRIGECRPTDPTAFITCAVTLPPLAKGAEIRMAFTHADAADTGGRSTLFTDIRLGR